MIYKSLQFGFFFLLSLVTLNVQKFFMQRFSTCLERAETIGNLHIENTGKWVSASNIYGNQRIFIYGQSQLEAAVRPQRIQAQNSGIKRTFTIKLRSLTREAKVS